MPTEDRIVDVRTEIPRVWHELIFQTFDTLLPDTAFVLVNDHDPKPLYYQLAAENAGQFTWNYLEEGPEVWRVRIGRSSQRDPRCAGLAETSPTDKETNTSAPALSGVSNEARQLASRKYQYGFVSDLDTDVALRG